MNVLGTEFTLGAIAEMFIRGKLTLTSKKISKKIVFKNKNIKGNFCWIPVVLRVLYIYTIKKSMGIL